MSLSPISEQPKKKRTTNVWKEFGIIISHNLDPLLHYHSQLWTLGGSRGSLSFLMYEMRIIVIAIYYRNYFVNYIY